MSVGALSSITDAAPPRLRSKLTPILEDVGRVSVPGLIHPRSGPTGSFPKPAVHHGLYPKIVRRAIVDGMLAPLLNEGASMQFSRLCWSVLALVLLSATPTNVSAFCRVDLLCLGWPVTGTLRSLYAAPLCTHPEKLMATSLCSSSLASDPIIVGVPWLGRRTCSVGGYFAKYVCEAAACM